MQSHAHAIAGCRAIASRLFSCEVYPPQFALAGIRSLSIIGPERDVSTEESCTAPVTFGQRTRCPRLKAADGRYRLSVRITIRAGDMTMGSWMSGRNLNPGCSSPRSFCRNASTVAAECTQLRPPGLGESRAARRSAVAERMILRILAHPETEHDAVFRMAGLARERTAAATRPRSSRPRWSPCRSCRRSRPPCRAETRACASSVPRASSSRSRRSADPFPESRRYAVPMPCRWSRCRAEPFSSSIIAADTAGCMTRSGRGRFSPLTSQSSRGWSSILVEQRLAVAANVVREARRHAKSAVDERGGRGHRQRVHLRGADRRRRIGLQHVLRVLRHARGDTRDRSRS